jgi:HlyD family secretion protein
MTPIRTPLNARHFHGGPAVTPPATPSYDIRQTLQIGTRKVKKVVRWIVLAMALMLGVAFIAGAAGRRSSNHVPRWVTEPARRSDVLVTVAATGKMHSLNTVDVGAEVTGKVLRVLVDYNDPVKKGQVLAEIDPELLRAAVEESSAQMASSRAGVRSSKATLFEAKQARVRAEELAKEGLVSKKDLEVAISAAVRAEANFASAKASARVAAASLKSTQSKLGKTTIVAPIDGIVLGRSVELGQTVTAGFQTPILFRLAGDLTKLALHVDIDEADIGRVAEGTTATFTVDAYPQKTFSSKVRSLRNEPKSSLNVVTYEAVLTVDNAERLLRPGMTATATITSQTSKDVLVVSNAALRFTPPALPGAPPAGQPSMRKQEKRVFVLRGGEVTPIAVRLGATDGQVTEVSGDIKVGDEVIVDAVLSS